MHHLFFVVEKARNQKSRHSFKCAVLGALTGQNVTHHDDNIMLNRTLEDLLIVGIGKI
jgi:hypothetical protein